MSDGPTHRATVPVTPPGANTLESPLPTRFGAAFALAAALCTLALPAHADDPACAVHSATVPVTFSDSGPVDFGPGFTGSVGSANLGLRYNFLLLGNYDWGMNGTLNLAWPPPLNVTATGTPMGGHLTVQYGLRLQFWFELLGMEIMLPVPVEVGVDRSEIGMSTFTPWVWDGVGTAVTVTAHERLLYSSSINVLGHTVDYDIYGAYLLTTTIASHDISFPQAMSSITATNPVAMVSPTSTGDMAFPTRWEGALHYVGSLQLRVVLTFLDSVCLPGLPICLSGVQTLTPPSLPFASATDQQVSSDRSVRVQLPGLQTPDTVDFGTIPLGLTGRQDIPLMNPGSLVSLVTPTAPSDRHFVAALDPLCIAGGATRTLSVRFIPDAVGHFQATLALTGANPSVPMATILLTADVTGPGTLPPPDAGSPSIPDAGAPQPTPDSGTLRDATLDAENYGLDTQGAGCGCRTTPVRSRVGVPLGLALLALSLRRRPVHR